MPDEALFDAAAQGRLATAEGVEDEARRMLDDPRAADTLHAFARQWMEVEDLWLSAPKDAETFAAWSPELAEAAELDMAKLLEAVVLEDDARLETVLLSRRAWVDDVLADLYGVAAPAGGEGWVDLPEEERAGMLTRAAFFAAHSHSDDVSWVHRGKLVRERFLCNVLPPPPPVAADAPLNDDARLEPSSTGTHADAMSEGAYLEKRRPESQVVLGVEQNPSPSHAPPGPHSASSLHANRPTGRDPVSMAIAAMAPRRIYPLQLPYHAARGVRALRRRTTT